MKSSDFFALLFFVALCLLVLLFPWTANPEGGLLWAPAWSDSFTAKLTGLRNFGAAVNAYPYTSGFLKVGILATFGELLKSRLKSGRWHTPDLFPKFLVWGLYGMLFTLVFALFAAGVQAVSARGLWFACSTSRLRPANRLPDRSFSRRSRPPSGAPSCRRRFCGSGFPRTRSPSVCRPITAC